MKVQTRYGEIDVRYWRDSEGREGLAATDPHAIFPVVLARDLSTTGSWEQTMDLALAEYIAFKQAIHHGDIETCKMPEAPPFKPKRGRR